MGDKTRGYLVITVAEASGRNKDEDEVWDPSFYEGFVKGACCACQTFVNHTTHCAALFRCSL